MKAGPARRRQPILVVAVGNRWRGDDGVGPAVARRLRRLAPAGVEVQIHESPASALLELPPGVGRLIVIDAAAPSTGPRRVHRFDVWNQPPPGDSPASSHALGLAESLALAKALHRLPRDTVLYAVEGSDFSHGARLSPQAQAAARICLSQILDEIG